MDGRVGGYHPHLIAQALPARMLPAKTLGLRLPQLALTVYVCAAAVAGGGVPGARAAAATRVVPKGRLGHPIRAEKITGSGTRRWLRIDIYTVLVRNGFRHVCQPCFTKHVVRGCGEMLLSSAQGFVSYGAVVRTCRCCRPEAGPILPLVFVFRELRLILLGERPASGSHYRVPLRDVSFWQFGCDVLAGRVHVGLVVGDGWWWGGGCSKHGGEVSGKDLVGSTCARAWYLPAVHARGKGTGGFGGKLRPERHVILGQLLHVARSDTVGRKVQVRRRPVLRAGGLGAAQPPA